jgi:alpha-tubulin suppressor-like RCC1 family protein
MAEEEPLMTSSPFPEFHLCRYLALLPTLLCALMVFGQSPQPASQSTRLPKVVAGRSHTVIILPSGTVRVWGGGGTNDCYFAGAQSPSIHRDASNPWTATPLAIPGLRNVVSISAGASVLALLADGRVREWGYNGFFSMGIGTNLEYPQGLQNPKLSQVAAIATGFNRSYFVLRDGTVLAAGFQRRDRGESFHIPTVILSKEESLR